MTGVQTCALPIYARYKVNPPLRTREDVQSLRLALADGTIDAIATDHAPHPNEDKDCEWSQAAFGMIGLQSAFSVITTALIDTGLMTWAQVSDRMSKRPAKIAGLRDQGQDLVIGSKANIAVVNPNIRLEFSLMNNASKSRIGRAHAELRHMSESRMPSSA